MAWNVPIVQRRVMSFFPGALLPEMLWVSRGARRMAFTVWIDDAIDSSLNALGGAVDFGYRNASLALNQLRISMTPWSAAMMYIMFTVGEKDAMNAGMTIKIAKTIKARLRDVLCRCICREVGFHNKSAYEDKVKQVFSSHLQQEPTIVSQMMLAFYRGVRDGPHPKISILHKSNASKRLRIRTVLVRRREEPPENGASDDAGNDGERALDLTGFPCEGVVHQESQRCPNAGNEVPPVLSVIFSDEGISYLGTSI